MGKLDGKVALITGGSSGIGLATCKRFVAEGARVFITGRRETELAAARNTIGRNVTTVRGDISILSDLDRVFEAIQKEAGHLDVLFANAGIGEFQPLGEITEDHFNKIFATNVKGTLFTVQKALSLMPRGSAIVINGSIASMKGIPAFSVYGASKAALRSFARTWAVDLKQRQIRVNVISPGTVPTPGYDKLGLSADQMDAFLKSQSEAVPLGRVGTSDEIANAVMFLACDESSYINGIELFVDGGIAQI